MEELVLKRAQFKKWLESKKPGEVVGERGLPYSCPVANYLRVKGGYIHPAVSSMNIRWGDEMHREGADSPRWASLFVRAVDGGLPTPTGNITARRALKVLEKCK